MQKQIHTLLALSLLTAPALAHNFTQKGFGQLKAETSKFAHAKSSPTARIGQPMPDFAAATLDGRGLSRQSFKGKISLFVLADTQCPCVVAVEERIKNL